jgi:hypothetical protein
MKRLIKIQTRETTDFSPKTKRLLAAAKKTHNFGKPVKPVPQTETKTKAEEYREAKARLMDTTPGKREQKLIDFHLQRAAELEKAGEHAEAVLYREHADMIRKHCIAIREVFTENIARHEKEIHENLIKPLEVLRRERKAKKAAKRKKIQALIRKQQSKKKGAE